MAEQFLWGAATSAHQIEGSNIHNDWWEAEQQGKVPFKSGRATDHWNRWRLDYALAKELGHTAHRLSLEWSRIEPEPGKWNQRALTQYREMLTELKRLGMRTFVTLHHFTNPRWFSARGGWASAAAPEIFARYVKIVAEQLGEHVDFWITINEPNVYAGQAFWLGTWPPRQRSRWAAWQVLRRMMRAHRAAYRVLHRVQPDAQVGIAHNVLAFPERSLKAWLYNHYFLWGTRRAHDFLGINYYRSVNRNWVGPVSDIGWEIDPGGLQRVLRDLHQYGWPIYITENGLADAEDTQRADFIVSHLRILEEAQRTGIDIRGYLHWSLLDNFEWDKGFSPRFGLVAVDYETLERRPRRSAYVYKAIIEQARGV